ncbi:MAG: TRAP transporter substrate-binding protein [SAR324 cluster bacterium]|nr:TRAP transporter substrate-binding protein [SAR324 cluster bacterium]
MTQVYKKIVGRFVGFAAAIGFVFSLGSTQALAVKLKFSTMEPPNGPMVNCFTLPLLEELNKESGGKIEIEKYMGGTAFAHPLRQYEQVARGVMDISQGVLSYTPGQFSLAEVATMPFLIDDAEIGARAVNKLAPEFLAEEFKDIHLLAILVTPPLYIHLRKPADGLFDLSGRRIRSTGVGAGALLEALGAIPVRLPAPAVYENLQTGVIDGALAEYVALRAFRIGEVTKYHLLANTTSALLFLGMNKATLAAMPADMQELIKTKYSGPEVGARASACWKKIGKKVFDGLLADGHQVIDFTETDKEKAKPIAEKIIADYIAKLEGQGKSAQAFYDALVSEVNRLSGK